MGARGSEKDMVLFHAWFRRENYPEIVRMCPEPETMHDTYDDWRADMRRVVRQLQREGFEVERVEVTPAGLAGFCAVRGLAPDGAARAQYAEELGRARMREKAKRS